MVKLLQYNCQGLLHNKDRISYFLDKNHIDIAIFSEIFKWENFNKLPNFNIIYKTRPDGYGGVAIALKKEINYRKIQYQTTQDIVIVETTNLTPNIKIAATYFPPNRIQQATFAKEFEKLVNFFENDLTALIAGDMNARNEAYGDPVSLPRGIKLKSIIDNSQFRILNDGSPTFNRFHDHSRHHSVLDLSLTNTNHNWNWRTLDVSITGSHHKPIMMDLKNTSIERKPFISSKKVMEQLPKLEIHPNIDEISNCIQSLISKNTYIVKSRSPKSWWDQRADKSYKEYRRSLKICNQFTNPDNITKMLAAKKQWYAQMKECKRDNWNNKISELNKQAGNKDFWKFIQSVKNHKNACTSKINWTHQQQSQYLEILKSYSPDLTNHTTITNDLSGFQHQPFTLEELQKALYQKKNTAAGTDHIKYNMIKILTKEQKEIVVEALNKQWRTGCIKDAWRSINIIPIPKPNKDLHLLESYRPIALMCIFPKLIEAMIKTREEHRIKGTESIPRNSFAFTKRKSATMCLNNILHSIRKHKAEEKYVMGISADISRAYDCVDLNILKRTLIDIKMDLQSIHWILDSLRSRKLKLKDASITVNNGLPQGSCLSPLLFNLYTRDMHELEDDQTQLFQFADDFFILVNGDNFEQTRQKLQAKLTEFQHRCNRKNLTFNPSKTTSILFSKEQQDINISTGATTIKQVKLMKLLGLDISFKLTNDTHYRRISSEIASSVAAIEMITTPKGGLYPRIANNSFKSLIRSKIEYARTVTCGTSDKKTEKKIEVLQNRPLRRCLGVPLDTPVHILYALAGNLPPHHRSFLLLSRELISLKIHHPTTYSDITSGNISNSSYTICYNRFRDILDATIGSNHQVSSNKISIEADMKGNIRLSKENVPAQLLKGLYDNYIEENKQHLFQILATDASLKDDIAGCSVYDTQTEILLKYKIEHNVSSMFAELTAIEKAVDYGIHQKYSKIMIMTDSKSSCLTLRSNREDNYLSTKIHTKIDEAKFLTSVKVLWVPSHVGIMANEIADRAAAEARVDGHSVPLDLTPAEAIKRITKSLEEDWQKEYEETSKTKGKYFFKIFPKAVTNEPWYNTIKMKISPKEVKLINRLMCNHTYNKVFLYRIKKSDSETCTTCNTKEDNEHIFFTCSRYTQERTKYPIFKNFKSIQDVLISKDKTNYRNLLDFANEIKFEG